MQSIERQRKCQGARFYQWHGRRSWTAVEWVAGKVGNWILETHETGPLRDSHDTGRDRVNRPAWRPRGTALVMSVLAMQAHANRGNAGPMQPWQWKDKQLLIPTPKRLELTTDVQDASHTFVRIFVGELRPSNRVVKGFAGSRTTNVQVGTLRWSWEDEMGKKHTFTIPNSYYVPDGQVRLLSPQHWSQTQTKSSQRATMRRVH